MRPYEPPASALRPVASRLGEARLRPQGPLTDQPLATALRRGRRAL